MRNPFINSFLIAVLLVTAHTSGLSARERLKRLPDEFASDIASSAVSAMSSVKSMSSVKLDEKKSVGMFAPNQEGGMVFIPAGNVSSKAANGGIIGCLVHSSNWAIKGSLPMKENAYSVDSETVRDTLVCVVLKTEREDGVCVVEGKNGKALGKLKCKKSAAKVISLEEVIDPRQPDSFSFEIGLPTNRVFFEMELTNTGELSPRELLETSTELEFGSLVEGGEGLKLSKLKGKYVLVDVWASWCAPCIELMPAIKAVKDDLGTRDDFAVLSINADRESDIEDARKIILRKKMGGIQVVAGKNRATLAAEGLPGIWLLDPNGNVIASRDDILGNVVVLREQGETENAALVSVIKELISANPSKRVTQEKPQQKATVK